MAKIPTMDEMAKQLAEKALDEVYYKDKSIREWVKIIASEDAISKSKTLEHLKARLYQTAMNNVGCTLEKAKMDDISGVFAEIAENRIDTWINELPPIQPHVYQWIEHIDRDDYDDSEELWYECPCCNGKHYRDSKYCPDCGAKMEVE